MRRFILCGFGVLSSLCAQQRGSPKVFYCEPRSQSFTLPPNPIGVMQHIHCSNKYQRLEFMENYLISVEREEKNLGGLIQRTSCLPLLRVWKKTKDSLCLPIMKNFFKIVNGAMKRIFGEDLGRDENIEMFHERLSNFDDVDDREVEELSELFGNLENPDFFRIMRATDFFKEYESLDTVNALKKAMKDKYQDLDFDQVHRALSYTRILKEPVGIYERIYINHYQVEMAKQAQFQKLNFDPLDDVVAHLKKNSLLTRESIEILTRPENQDMDWKKVIEMIPYATKNMRPTSNQIVMIFDRKYQQYDMKLVDWVYERLEQLAPNNLKNVDWALENWLEYFANGLDLNKLDKIFVKCKGASNPILCFKLKKLSLKEPRNNGENSSNDESSNHGQGSEHADRTKMYFWYTKSCNVPVCVPRKYFWSISTSNTDFE